MMGPDVIAAIAALVIAFVALIVASAQALQQYLLSGQLIRLCDSVVYNRMPGQGHRIWQFSQFRFRVVYSIPQIHLLPDLWMDISPHIPSLPHTVASLPDLKVHKSGSDVTAMAGEASWVSFIRAVQWSSGRSLRYVMVEGDADRCPLDLPVVPMQLSMREVIVTALMSGMECTDISFKSQSLSMQGDAGTITSSRHPVLGSLIHYAPRRALESHGFQALGGTVQADWIARLVDVVTVAGYRYDCRQRKHHEEDEVAWMKSFNDRRLIKTSSARNPSPDPIRRQASVLDLETHLAHHESALQETNGSTPNSGLEHVTTVDLTRLRRRQDGDWCAAEAAMSNPSLSILDYTHQQLSSSKRIETLDFVRRKAGRLIWKPSARTTEPKRLLQKPYCQKEDKSITVRRKVPLPGYLDASRTVSLNRGTGSNTNSLPRDENAYLRLEGGFQELPTSSQIVVSMLNQVKSRDQGPTEKRRSELMTRHGKLSFERRSASADSQDLSNKDGINLQDQARQEAIVDNWVRALQERHTNRSLAQTNHWWDERPLLRIDLPITSVNPDGSMVPHTHSSMTMKEDQKFPRPSVEDTVLARRDNTPMFGQSLRSPRAGKVSGANSRGRESSHETISSTQGQQWQFLQRNSFKPEHASPFLQSYRTSNHPIERGRKRVRVVFPIRSSDNLVRREYSPPRTAHQIVSGRPALRPSTKQFFEDPDFVRPGVTRRPGMGRQRDHNIPDNARMTKIKRLLVDPVVLVAAKERFEEYGDSVVVLRVLSRAEIQRYAAETQKIRKRFLAPPDPGKSKADDGNNGSTDESDDSQGSFVRQRNASRPNDLVLGASNVKMSLDGGDTLAHRESLPDERSDRHAGALPEPSTSIVITGHKGLKNLSRLMSPAGAQDNASILNPPNELFKDWDSSIPQTTPPATPRRRSSNHEGAEQDPISTERSASRSPGQEPVAHDNDGVSYAEELLLLDFDDILKKLKGCREECNDVITTLQFVESIHPELGSKIGEVKRLTMTTNRSVERLLYTIATLDKNKRNVGAALNGLKTLLSGLRASLDVLCHQFDIHDITHISNEERQQAWMRTIMLFEERYNCSMRQCARMTQALCTEITLNLRAGVLNSQEASILSRRLQDVIEGKSIIVRDPTQSKHSLVSQHDAQSSRSDDSQSPRPQTGSPSRSLTHTQRRIRTPKDTKRSSAKSQRSSRYDFSPNIDSTAVEASISSTAEAALSLDTPVGLETKATGEMKWFWICQADCIPGYFATPWKSVFSFAECLGIITVVLRCLEVYTNHTNLQYEQTQRRDVAWLRRGRSTYPPFAYRAAGGVVVAGKYHMTTFDSFASPIFPIELQVSYERQIDHSQLSSTPSVIENCAEITALDSWLAISGRQIEIAEGPSSLLLTLPTMIQRLLTDLHLEFCTVERARDDGGGRIIRTVSDSLLGYLQEGSLTAAEQLFALIALLRTAKMGMCISRGPDTAKLKDVLMKDVQVYLA